MRLQEVIVRILDISGQTQTGFKDFIFDPAGPILVPVILARGLGLCKLDCNSRGGH
jgi:hypothetical protein